MVKTLVNNAGFGLRGDFDAVPWDDDERMLPLMVSTCSELCHALLPAMKRAGDGRLLNVAPLAGLIPGLPGSALDSACKAFLIRLCLTLAMENRRSWR